MASLLHQSNTSFQVLIRHCMSDSDVPISQPASSSSSGSVAAVSFPMGLVIALSGTAILYPSTMSCRIERSMINERMNHSASGHAGSSSPSKLPKRFVNMSVDVTTSGCHNLISSRGD